MGAHRTSLTPPPERKPLVTSPTNNNNSSSKSLFRPYCLEDKVEIKKEMFASSPVSPPTAASITSPFHPYYSPTPLKYRNIEDINTAHAILDLSKTSTQYPTSSTPADIKPMISTMTASMAASMAASNTSQSTPPPCLLSPAL